MSKNSNVKGDSSSSAFHGSQKRNLILGTLLKKQKKKAKLVVLVPSFQQAKLKMKKVEGKARKMIKASYTTVQAGTAQPEKESTQIGYSRDIKF